MCTRAWHLFSNATSVAMIQCCKFKADQMRGTVSYRKAPVCWLFWQMYNLDKNGGYDSHVHFTLQISSEVHTLIPLLQTSAYVDENCKCWNICMKQNS